MKMPQIIVNWLTLYQQTLISSPFYTKNEKREFLIVETGQEIGSLICQTPLGVRDRNLRYAN
jgi:hypothetical protein